MVAMPGAPTTACCTPPPAPASTPRPTPAHWALAGLEGQIARGVTLEPDRAVGVAPRICVAVDDAVAIYQKP
jgi:hypothetical protein